MRYFLVFLAFILCACAPPAPTATPTATWTPEPTLTPTPFYTPTPDPCSKAELTKYLAAVDDVARRFDDANSLAGSTQRMNLPPVIADLQAIRRDTEDLKVPECASTAKEYLITYMNLTIESFRLFLIQESDYTVNAKIMEAQQELLVYQKAMADLGYK